MRFIIFNFEIFSKFSFFAFKSNFFFKKKAVSQAVSKLVEEEMKKFQPRDYLADLPPVPDYSSKQSEMIKNELLRVKSGKKLPKRDVAKYENLDLVAPKDGASLEELDKAVNQVATSVEYAGNKLINSEFMAKYNKNLWTHQVASTMRLERKLEEELAVLKREEEKINKKRKLDQVSAANEFRNLEQVFFSFFFKTTKKLKLKMLSKKIKKQHFEALFFNCF